MEEAGFEVALLSTDSGDKAKAFAEANKLTVPVGFGLTETQARGLGLYLSKGREGTKEPALFAEPGMYVLNSKGQLAVVDVANNPIVRPDLGSLVGTLQFL